MQIATSQEKTSPAPRKEWDEVALAGTSAAAAYGMVMRSLEQLGPDSARLQAKARKLMRDLGVTHPLYHEKQESDHIVPFDPVPRILDTAEWQSLAAGLAQRVKVWNAFLRDIYGQQEVLKAGVIPFELVYDDPHYLRPAVSLTPTEDQVVRVASMDLARDDSGQWVVTEDHVSDFSGPSYAIQSRNVLTSVWPGLLERTNVRGVSDYPAELLERLQGRNPSAATEPRLVMLTTSPEHSAYYEHSTLARLMGIPLVRGNDLTVLNSRVFLRTIGGLEPIDVIYRRMDEDLIDPLAFQSESPYGVPGLLHCVREGTVSVVNAIGNGLGNNVAITSYLGRLAKFYCNESLLLPTVERLWCNDPDQLETVFARFDQFRIRHVFERSRQHEWVPAMMEEDPREDLRRRMRAMSGQFIAEPLLPLTLLPVVGPGGFEKRHAGLRLFAWGGAGPSELPPCALTRFATQPQSRGISSGLGGGIKDTWILGQEEEEPTEAPIQIYSPQRRLRLSSRIADSLYWMGRYKCRAENTTRILKVLLLLQVEDHDPMASRPWNALWEALARATGHATHFFKKSARFRRQTVAHYVLLDAENPSSIRNAIRHCRRNAQLTRESVPPELWFIINRLDQTLESASEETRGSRANANSNAANAVAPGPGASTPLSMPELLDEVLNQLDALSGSAAKSMLHDDGYHFWNMGIYIERALNTLLVMRQVLMKRHDEEGKSPRRDESNLDALLRMLACQYAYRSLFQTRPQFHNVAAMVLQDPQLPRSVLFALQGIRHALESVFSSRINPLDRPEDLPPIRQCARLISEIEFADLTPYFTDDHAGRTGRLRPWLDGLADRLADLATRISDHYLYHQNFRLLS